MFCARNPFAHLGDCKGLCPGPLPPSMSSFVVVIVTAPFFCRNHSHVVGAHGVGPALRIYICGKSDRNSTPDTTSPLILKNSASTVVCAISNTGDITSGGSTVLTTAYSPYHCAGKVSGSGTVLNSSGRVSYTVNKSTTGTYAIAYSSAFSGGGGGGQIITATANGSSRSGC